MAKIYLASKLKHAERWRQLANDNPRHTFTARWPYIVGYVDDSPKNANNFWEHDFNDIDFCDALIVVADPDDVLRGALVEVGYAIAKGKHVIVVGENDSYGTWRHSYRVRTAETIEQAFTWVNTLIARR